MKTKEIVEQYIKVFKYESQRLANGYEFCPFKNNCNGHGSCMVKNRKYACLDESDQAELIANWIIEGYERWKDENDE